MKSLPGIAYLIILFISYLENYPLASDKSFKGATINALLEGHPTDKAAAKLLPEFEKKTRMMCLWMGKCCKIC